ncbi:DUF3800 domain-containing protein [Paramicrobacterium sp. CJ85]|uniref:DUF3800 domain-containing protein n=1 Tax=Paramicrobacterium sp. CJ85 TaxID=3445355 RepID=UPI003F63360E
MLLAYIDEIGETGAFVSKDHKRFKTSPVFGYAGFVIPVQSARDFGRSFTEEKRRLFAAEIAEVGNPGRWERKGSDIFTADAWQRHPSQIRVFRGLVTELSKYSGKIFYFAQEKERGTPKQVATGPIELESAAMQETINRLCPYAHAFRENLLIVIDQVNEKQRAERVANMYKHIFARSRRYPEMAAIVEPPMHVDSTLSSNIQFADWIAASIGRAIDYQLFRDSRFGWIPDALGGHMHHNITFESKLKLWNSSLDDLHHFDVFRKSRPLLPHITGQLVGDANRAQLTKAIHLASTRRAPDASS